LWHRELPGADLEIALRLFLGIAVLLPALCCLRQTQLNYALWGYVLAALAATLFIAKLSLPEFVRPYTNAVYNAVGYGNHTLMLAVLVLFSIKLTITPWPRLERLLKLLIAAVALTAFV